MGLSRKSTAPLVALEDAPLIGESGGYEDDRDGVGTNTAAHHFCQLEAVNLRHLDIQDRERDAIDQQQLERFSS